MGEVQKSRYQCKYEIGLRFNHVEVKYLYRFLLSGVKLYSVPLSLALCPTGCSSRAAPTEGRNHHSHLPAHLCPTVPPIALNIYHPISKAANGIYTCRLVPPFPAVPGRSCNRPCDILSQIDMLLCTQFPPGRWEAMCARVGICFRASWLASENAGEILLLKLGQDTKKTKKRRATKWPLQTNGDGTTICTVW